MGITSSTARVAIIPGATYLGCYTDLIGASNVTRILPDAYVNSYDMSVEKCATIMSGYKYFGVEYANECFGANTLDPGAQLAPATDCNFECVGAMSDQCGAGYRINVYQAGSSSAGVSDQCSLIVTSYISDSTVTLPPATITKAASTITVTATATTVATPTSTPDISSGLFYLYSDSLGMFVQASGNDDFRSFTFLPSTIFEYTDQYPGTINVVNTSTPLTYFGGSLPDLPLIGWGTTQSALACNIANNSIVTCALSGANSNKFGSCQVEPWQLFGSLRPPNLAIGVDSSNTLGHCENIDLRAISVSSITPGTLDPMYTGAPHRFNLEVLDGSNNSLGFADFDGTVSPSPVYDVFLLNGTYLDVAGITFPMLIAGQGNDPFGSNGGYGMSTQQPQYQALTRPLDCAATANHTLSCQVDNTLTELAVCNDRLTLFTPETLVNSSCASVSLRFSVPANLPYITPLMPSTT